MITKGTPVVWNGRTGIVQMLAYSIATHRQIATVAFSHHETLRVPVEDLKEAA